MDKVLESTEVNEKIFVRELKNGLKVYILPKKGYVKQYAVYAAHFGSIDSEFKKPGGKKTIKVPDGIAHFLEHKMFEEKEGNVFEEFMKYGAQANAYTNFTTTAYLFSCTQYFNENLDILLKFVNNPYFTDENVEKEKGIIGQEIRMYEDNPQWRVFFNLLKGMYQYHPVNKDIAGTIDSIALIDKETLYECYSTFYHPSNMVLFIVGDIEVERVFDQVEDFFQKATSIKNTYEIGRVYPQEPKDISKKEIKEKLSVSNPLFAIGFKDDNKDLSGTKLLKRSIITEICLDIIVGKSSNLYNNLYNDGLIDLTFDKSYTGEVNYGYTMFSGESKDPKKVNDYLMETIETFKKEPIDVKNFTRIQKKEIGTFLRSFNSIDYIAHSFIDNIFKDIIFFDKLKVMNEISVEDIQQRIQEYFEEESMTLSIITTK